MHRPKQPGFIPRLLLAGASLTALASLTPQSNASAASAAQLLSPGNLMQTATQRANTASQTAVTPLLNPAVQAQIAVSTAYLQQAAQALRSLQAAQAAAGAASKLTLNNAPLSGSAWNGNVLSGLKPVDDTNGNLWINAGQLQKDTGTATATVKQTASKALLTWQSFDLNKGETIAFDQQGHADWSVLNRVVAGPTNASGSRFVASPSYILGAVKAAGSVYVINPNGIIFGPNSQVNVHSLIASSLDVGNPTMTLAERNSFYLNQGITSATGVNSSFSYYQSDTAVQGDVKVMAGATITTDLAPRNISPDAGGFVYLFGPNVENDGSITTPAGETLMVAAQRLQLTPNIYAGGGAYVSTDPTQKIGTFRAVGVSFTLDAQNANASLPWRTDGAKSGQIATPGSVVNTGLINAQRGVVILNGDTVSNGALRDSNGNITQSGVIRADTSITRNSQIFLDARVSVTLDGGSSIQVLPDENGETIPLSTVESSTTSNPSFVAGAVEMRGNTVDIESGSLVLNPGGSVSISGVTPQQLGFYQYPQAVQRIVDRKTRDAARIYMASDSAIDVSGLDDVVLPMSDNLVSFSPFGNEFADQPLQRFGALRGVKLTVDIRQTGTYNGTAWVGTPLANVSKIAGNVSRSIDQLLTTGGTVSISSQGADEVVLRQGSSINVAGGYVRYEGGVVATTNLVTADGRIVNIANADPLQTYVGVAGVSTLEHAHWGPSTSRTFTDPILKGGQYQAGYIEGHDAGGISLNSNNPAAAYVLDGTFYGSAITGERQAAQGTRPTSTTANTIAADPNAIPSSAYLNILGDNDLVLTKTVAALSQRFTVASKLPTSRSTTTTISTDSLTQAGFGQITANFTGSLDLTANARLSVADGGAISLTAGSAEIDGDLTARSGTISIQTKSTVAAGKTITVNDPTPPDLFDLVIGAHAMLDASGRWVNDTAANSESLIGSAFVNGGSIKLGTVTAAVPCSTAACTSLAGLGTTASVDITGNIVLAKGSLLDVDSGGRVGTNGKFQLDSVGRAVGTGGNVGLQTYVGGFNTNDVSKTPTTTLPQATIIFGGSDGSAEANALGLENAISGYGFAKGGTLAIQAPSIRVGSGKEAGTFNVSSGFFDGNGFGEYDLTSAAGTLTVAENQTLTLRQRNFVANPDVVSLRTGSVVRSATGVDYLPTFARSPVNLALVATLAPLPEAPYNPPATSTALDPAVALLIDKGAVIAADPQAKVSAAVVGRTSNTPSNGSQVGIVDDQVGVAEILGTIRAPGGSIALTARSEGEIWLGSTSRLDASGAVLIDPRQVAYRSGTVLAGGSVSISASDKTGSIIGLAGARIDVSGADGTLDLPTTSSDGLSAINYQPADVWSDAGSIAFSAQTMVYQGRFAAKGGAPEANGGSLTISAPTSEATVTVRQGGGADLSGLTPTDPIGTLANTILLDANRLDGSGIANLTLSAGPQTGQVEPGTVKFARNVTIAGLNRLVIDASTISIANVAPGSQSTDCSVCLSAHYFEWLGSGDANATKGTGILTVKADFIDFVAGGAASNVISLSGAASADFISSGDIRLMTPLANADLALDPGSLLVGQLVTTGNLTLQASQVYPATGVDFTLKSSGPAATITIAGNGKSAETPLSAGGQVSIDAAKIVQDGRLVAPLGVIRLGAATKADLSPNDQSGVFVATRKVTLGKDSVTSVSLDGALVPYGETADGKNWSYENQNGIPLTQAPAKRVSLVGKDLELAKGASVDLSGGGDVQAMEFVNGTGGTRDVLAGDSNVYAIIPGYNPAAAPVDYDFAKIQKDAQPLAGTSVYLTASSGLPAGYYTLLPAHYATLPGSYRVKLVQGVQDAVASQNRVLPDGTLQVAGYLADGSAGTRAARSSLFQIQSDSVWRQYSEIDQTSGNTYFAGLAKATDTQAARLPQDAGHLVIDATQRAKLLATLDAAPATGGRGSEVDIAGSKLQILSGSATRNSGFVGLDANQLAALGADSLLIGGVRSDDATAEVTITPTATAVEISTSAAAPLQAPEILLVAATPSKGQGDGITLDDRSAITSRGTLADGDPTSFTIKDAKNQAVGDSVFLAVTSGKSLSVTRSAVKAPAGDITIGSNVTLSGNALTVDALGSISFGKGTKFSLNSVDIGGTAMSVGVASATTGAILTSANVAALRTVGSLTLRSTGTIDFFGGTGIALSGKQSSLTLDSASLTVDGDRSVTLSANKIDLVNSGVAAGAAQSGSGRLTLQAQTISLGDGAKTIDGVSSVSLTGTDQVTITGSGSLDLGAAALQLDTPRILVSTGAGQSLTTTGVAVLSSSNGTGSVIDAAEIGGTLSIQAASITDSTLIQAIAGAVKLEATDGDVDLTTSARIEATGYARTFFDVVRVASGGSIGIVADKGSIDIARGAHLNVSSAAGHAGSAGTIALSATSGGLASSGAAFDFSTLAGSVTGDGGGRLTIAAGSLGADTVTIPGMFSQSVDVRVLKGDLKLGGDLAAQSVVLTADAGLLTIDRTVDASGPKGGTISLFGGRGVTLTASGKIVATASDATKRGGDVLIGTEVADQNGSGADGVISLNGGSIDVSNTASATQGGTVRLRAPLVGSHDVSIGTVKTSVVGASAITVEAFKVYDTKNSAFTGVIDPIAQPGFYGSCNAAGTCTGTLVEFVQNFALSSSAVAKFAGLPSASMHFQPGIELVNNDTSAASNNGDITVANAWNLGAGLAGDLVNLTEFTAAGKTIAAGTVVTDANGHLLPEFAGYTGQLGFVSGVSQISKLFYRVGGAPTGEAGTLTLRAARDLNLNASISDGFFQTANRLDKTYLQNLNTWISSAGSGGASTNISNVGGYIIAGSTATSPVDATGKPLDVGGLLGAPPIAPYAAAANAISPVATRDNPVPLAGADLFPLIKDAHGAITGVDGTYSAVQSWSYRLVGGADTSSANPLAVAPLGAFADGATGSVAGHGDVIIAGGGPVRVQNVNSDGLAVTFEIPTMIRTGTGSIDIAAGRDFSLANVDAPGVVYTAGRSSVALADPGYKMQEVDDPLNPGSKIKIAVATNPSGFLSPDLLTCDPGATYNCNAYGPVTQAAYPVAAGHLTISAQRDILAHEDTSVGGRASQPSQQYFAPWLIAQGSSLNDTEYGTFSTLSAYVTTGGNIYSPSQTSWWINFGSFDQGVMSVGGDIQVTAGRDIVQLGVSAPTTARVSGGLSSTIVDSAGRTVSNVPVMHLNGSGDITVIAGRNIASGAFYEGSGNATITAGGQVAADWSAHAVIGDRTSPLIAVSTVLAVDTGKIALSARSGIDIAGVVSATSLQNVADLSGLTNPLITSSYISSYGPESGVAVQSTSGDVTLNSLAVAAGSAKILIANGLRYNGATLDDSGYRGVSAYPASLESVSLSGDVVIEAALQLAASNTGTLNLLAQGSLLTRSSVNYENDVTLVADGFQALSTGPSIIEQVFAADAPLAGFGPASGAQVADLGPTLVHSGDTTADRMYAVTGDIVSGQGQTAVPTGGKQLYALSWEINKPAQVHAGRDIVDLPYFGQNLAAADVTQILAGRDLYYTGALPIVIGSFPSRPDLGQTENSAGLSLAGPGFFDVEAGRNLGPFVTAAADVAASEVFNAGSDATGTGIVTFGNNVTVGNRLMIDGHDTNQQKLVDPFATGTNTLLPRQGAAIIALFGVGNGIDYQAVTKAYIDPATATSSHNYSSDLVSFLQTLGQPAQSPAAAWTSFQALSANLQHIFVEQVYFNELKLTGTTKDFTAGYKLAATLFPTSFGYTDNGVAGSASAERVATGDLEMLHATIKTLQSTTESVTNTDGSQSSLAVGGDVMILGPGGDVTVGSQAIELNTHLTASALGILTLDNGKISTFTDGSVLVNQSRILTVQGGDIVLWSSNGDLDAGRGAKTTVDFKPLSVNFDPWSLQTINLNGLVSGAGIGTIQSTPDAPTASATLIAPRGTVNAGDAGLRSSGSLAIVALRVLNASNISALGAVSGVPQAASVNLGSLESASSTAGAGAQAAQDAVAAAASRNAPVSVKKMPSLVTVEVLGFGDCDPDAGRACQQ